MGTSTRQVSGSSYISTNSPLKILWTSLGGMRARPGTLELVTGWSSPPDPSELRCVSVNGSTDPALPLGFVVKIGINAGATESMDEAGVGSRSPDAGWGAAACVLLSTGHWTLALAVHDQTIDPGQLLGCE